MRALLLASLAVAPLTAQSLDDLRRSVRDAAQSSHYATFLAGFLGLTGESELSGARLEIDDAADTELSLFTYPLRRDVPLGAGDGAPKLRFEGDLGYAVARVDLADAYDGQAPGFETRVKSRYEAFGGFAGVGIVVPFGAVSVTPLVVGGLAHVENTTYYQGPGATATAALFDGIVFNWDATYSVYGGGLVLQHDDLVLGDVRITPRLRYDLRRSDPLSADDPTQDEATTYEWLIARVDFEGPCGVQVAGREVHWTGEFAYKRFLDEVGDLLGFDDYFELGLGLRWGCRDLVPLLGECGLGGALLVGEDVLGWTFGVTVRF